MSARPRAPQAEPRSSILARRFRDVRAATLALVEGLDAEDLCPQSMPEASPGKWHLGHTTWFFEAFVLRPACRAPWRRPGWEFLFNSYYEALGDRHARPRRGLLTRPALDAVLAWRGEIDAAMLETLLGGGLTEQVLDAVELGLNHEQQHQELLVTDLKHLLAQNRLVREGHLPAWRPPADTPSTGRVEASAWHRFAQAGPATIGAGAEGFAYDNERPRHTVWLAPFEIASRPLSCGEYLEFIAAGGYREPRWWLSDGWDAVQAGGWQAPLYWRRDGDGWLRFGVDGSRPVDPAAPVSHLSFYEADACARFAGARLPTEAEWEFAATALGWTPAESAPPPREPAAGTSPGGIGEVWEWTASAYSPYPGFRPLPGAAGEYNGKFMSGQMVLRGGSCATPAGHARISYRNFFPPAARWQFSGLRLARDLT